MKPLFTPNIPSGAVSLALLASNATESIKQAIKQRQINIVEILPIDSLPSPLTMHADMQVVNLGEGLLVHAPNVNNSTLRSLKELGFTLISGETQIRAPYPFDVAYNCAIVGRNVFLNVRYTDRILLEALEKLDYRIISVQQGYAKCSTCIIGAEAVITADKAIHSKAVEAKLDSLLIPPQKNILLEGYDYGFIGGATGLLSETELGFFGDYRNLLDSSQMLNFLDKHFVKPVSLSSENLVDLGGLIPLCSV